MKKFIMNLILVMAVSFCSAEVAIHDIISGAQDLNIRNSADITSVMALADIGATVTAIAVQSNGDIVLGTENGVLIKYDKTLTLQKNYVGGFGGKITSLDIMSNDNVVAGVAAANGQVWVLDKDTLLNISNQGWLGSGTNDPVYVAVYGDDKVAVVGKTSQKLWFRDTDVTQVDPDAVAASYTLYGGLATGLAVQSTGHFIPASLGLSGKVWRFTPTGSILAEKGYMGTANTSDHMFVGVLSNDRVVTMSSFAGTLFNLPADISSYGTNYNGESNKLQVGDVTAMTVTNEDKVIIATTYGATSKVGSLFVISVNLNDNSMTTEQEIYQTLPYPAQALAAWEPALATCEDIWAAGLGYAADFNMDCKVDLVDFAVLAQEWITNYQP